MYHQKLQPNGRYTTQLDMSADEETLIEKIIALRLAGAGNDAPAALLEKIQADGAEGLISLAQVKKAASKATKKMAKDGSLAPSPAALAEAAKPAPAPVVSAAKQKKQEKSAAAELKAAQAEMMEAQRRLRSVKNGGDASMAVTITGSAEDFVQKITAKALSGVLEADDDKFLKERIDADIAALEWVKLASSTGALKLTEDVVALGGEMQLARLKEVRGAKDYAAARACFVEEKNDGTYQSVDKAVARAAGRPTGTNDEMDEMD